MPSGEIDQAMPPVEVEEELPTCEPHDVNAFTINMVLDELASDLLSLEPVRSLELLKHPQPEGMDFLLRITPWHGPALRIGLRTSFSEGAQEDFDKALEVGEKSERSFDKQLWFSDSGP